MDLQKAKPPQLSEGICVQSLFGKKSPPSQESGFKVSSLASIYEYLETLIRGGVSKECVCSPREWKNTKSICLIAGQRRWEAKLGRKPGQKERVRGCLPEEGHGFDKLWRIHFQASALPNLLERERASGSEDKKFKRKREMKQQQRSYFFFHSIVAANEALWGKSRHVPKNK